MSCPAPPHSFPTKNEMADYLESYAARFALPVRTGTAVDRLSRTMIHGVERDAKRVAGVIAARTRRTRPEPVRR